MKNNQTFWALLALALGAILVAAWNPSAASFNTNQFSNPNYNINIKSGVLLTNATIKGNSASTNAFYIDGNGVIISNAVNQVVISNGTVSATGSLIASNSLAIGTNGWKVTPDGNVNISGIWDRFVGGPAIVCGITNSSATTMFYSNNIPAHTIGSNGVVRVTVLGLSGFTPGNATLNIKYGGAGGTQVGGFTYISAPTSTRYLYQQRIVFNQNSESSQYSFSTTTGTYTDTAGTLFNTTVDTSTNIPITVSLTSNNATGTNAILAMSIEILHKN